MNREQARKWCEAAGKRRRAARLEAEGADEKARAAAEAGLRAGLTIAEVAQLTDYHRNSIRAIRDHMSPSSTANDRNSEPYEDAP